METYKPVIRWWSLVNPRILAHFSESLVVQPDRFIFSKGILQKSEMVVPFSRITNYGYEQTLFDRLFGVGDFRIETAGSSIAPELILRGYSYKLRDVLAASLNRA